MADESGSIRDRVMAKVNKQKGSGVEYGKVPPQAIDLEEAVLGALMIEKEPPVVNLVEQDFLDQIILCLLHIFVEEF